MLQVRVDRLTHLGAQPVSLKQPAETEDRGLVGCAPQGFDAGESAPRRAVPLPLTDRSATTTPAGG